MLREVPYLKLYLQIGMLLILTVTMYIMKLATGGLLEGLKQIITQNVTHVKNLWDLSLPVRIPATPQFRVSNISQNDRGDPLIQYLNLF